MVKDQNNGKAIKAGPVYQRLYMLLAEQIRDGKYKPSEMLPSESRLATEYECSRVSVRNALQLLEDAGLIYRRKGKGTFVKEPEGSSRNVERMKGLPNDLVAYGLGLTAKQIKWAFVQPSADVAKQLRISTEETCLHICRVRYHEGQPVSFTNIYVPEEAGKTLRADPDCQSLVIEQLDSTPWRLEKSTHALTATIANGDVAKYLDLPSGTPLLRMRAVSSDKNGTPVYYQESLYNSALYEYTVDLARGGDDALPTWKAGHIQSQKENND